MVYMPHWPVIPVKKPIDNELQRMKAILSSLGSPHLNLPPVIHVAGTNGKGSVVAFLREIFFQAGYKVSVYTSPHLHRFNERIVIDNEEISDQYLFEIMEEVRINYDNSIDAGFFELTTAGAMLAFSRSKSDILIVEVGMGGRIDPTNIFDNPLLSVITPISFDHKEFLGDDIASIAAEKSHIMRNGVKAIIGPQSQIAKNMIELRSIEIGGNELSFFGDDFNIGKFIDGFLYSDQNEDIFLPFPKLIGDHQLINAAIAINAIKNLPENKYPKINNDIVALGLQNVRWQARLEKLAHDNQLVKSLNDTHGADKKSEIYLDGAHNIAGAFVINRFLTDLYDSEIEEFGEAKEIYLIIGKTRNRDQKSFLNAFNNNKIKHIATVTVIGEPDPEPADIIEKAGRDVGITNISSHPNLMDAVTYINQSSNKEKRVVICGSLFLARDVLMYDIKSHL